MTEIYRPQGEVDEIMRWARDAPVPGERGLYDDLAHLEAWISAIQPLVSNGPRSLEGREPGGERDIQRRIAEARASCVAAHRRTIFDAVTRERTVPVRLDQLMIGVSTLYPALLPTGADLARDRHASLASKRGCEMSIGLVLSALLDDPAIGATIAQWMRYPLPVSRAKLDGFMRDGVLDLLHVHMRRAGRVTCIEMRSPHALNAEDGAMNEALEIAADIALMDPETHVIVLRGGTVESARYRGRRVFCSGVNLTMLYEGKIPLMFYIEREMGFVSKILRGLHQNALSPFVKDTGVEKPWVAAVDTHAIGGGLQLLLVCDHVIADQDAFLSVPARAEGFIPGLANLRLPHYVGRRLANRLIYRNERLQVTSEAGALLVDSVVAAEDMDAGIERAVQNIMQLGTAGMVSNRRAFCLAMETPAQFVAYMSLLAREQALCMYGVEVSANLERMWIQRRDAVGSTS